MLDEKPQIEISSMRGGPNRITPRNVLMLIVVLVFLVGIFYLFVGGFSRFSAGKIVYVEKGMGALQIANKLKSENIFSGSPKLLTLLIVAFGGENNVVAGPYYFGSQQGMFNIARRLILADYDIRPIKITIPEGFTVRQIAERLEQNIARFDSDAFISIAESMEGYLFPDTYLFTIDVTGEDVVETMSANFDEKIADIKQDVLRSKKDLSEIIIMASIIEREVQSVEDKKIVSGIFWKRIEIGMPLQADSTLTYEVGKTSAELSTEDLRTDSPYNTYTNRGLPPTPISNPGLDSIQAAVEPSSSPYLYFLTDEEGAVHYAKDFEEHKLNKAKYIY